MQEYSGKETNDENNYDSVKFALKINCSFIHSLWLCVFLHYFFTQYLYSTAQDFFQKPKVPLVFKKWIDALFHELQLFISIPFSRLLYTEN